MAKYRMLSRWVSLIYLEIRVWYITLWIPFRDKKNDSDLRFFKSWNQSMPLIKMNFFFNIVSENSKAVWQIHNCCHPRVKGLRVWKVFQRLNQQGEVPNLGTWGLAEIMQFLEWLELGFVKSYWFPLLARLHHYPASDRVRGPER